MTKGQKAFLFLALAAVGGAWLYYQFHPAPLPEDAFDPVFNLTPEQLQAQCGPPAQDASGALLPDDGIRDLHYRTPDGRTLLLRFITEDGSAWQSLGAWDPGTQPGDLGAPLEPFDAARRLPCVTRNVAAAQPLPSTHLVLPGAGSDTAAPGDSPASGADDRIPVSPTFLPCPSDAVPCEMLDYESFVAQFQQAIQAEKDNHFEVAVDRLTEHGVLVVQLTGVDLDSPIRQIFRLEVRAINIVAGRLRDDVKALEPIPAESDSARASKMRVVMADDLQRRRMWKQAVEANRPPASSADPDQTLEFHSQGYQQMVHIHLTGNW